MSSSGVVLHLFCEETAVIVTWNVVVAVDDVEVVVVVVKRASPALHSRSARSDTPMKGLAFHCSYITLHPLLKGTYTGLGRTYLGKYVLCS